MLWPQLMEVDLFASISEFKVPVFLMEGRHDHEVPSELAARYFDQVKAPFKKLIWFENSAHMPITEERECFNQLMVSEILPLAS